MKGWKWKKAQLESDISNALCNLDAIEALYENARAEAIKEFAEKLKANRPHLNTGEQVFYIRPEEVDNLVKEMVGADNG